MKNEYKIELSSFKGLNNTSLTGRPQGKKVRITLDLDKIESKFDLITVHVPKGTTSLNPSFFLGLFYNSIKRLGSIELFCEKFKFIFSSDESEILKELIEDNIEEALIYAKNSLNDSKRGYLSF